MTQILSPRVPVVPNDALIVIDVQNDFCPGGALAVPKGDEVVSVINTLTPHFGNVIYTLDWHPEGHVSFASSHPGKKPFDTMKLEYGEQVLWPDHCVQGSYGAEFHPGINSSNNMRLIFTKGFHADTDSYSAFSEANGRVTGLTGYLDERGIERVFLVGLATDYCVAQSALDAVKFGFRVYVIEDACRAIDQSGSLENARNKMLQAGVILITSDQII